MVPPSCGGGPVGIGTVLRWLSRPTRVSRVLRGIGTASPWRLSTLSGGNGTGEMVNSSKKDTCGVKGVKWSGSALAGGLGRRVC